MTGEQSARRGRDGGECGGSTRISPVRSVSRDKSSPGLSAISSSFTSKPPLPLKAAKMGLFRLSLGMPLGEVLGDGPPTDEPITHPIWAEVSITRISSGPCDRGSW